MYILHHKLWHLLYFTPPTLAFLLNWTQIYIMWLAHYFYLGGIQFKDKNTSNKNFFFPPLLCVCRYNFLLSLSPPPPKDLQNKLSH